MSYRLWVNDDRTVLVRLWDSGEAETARRASASHTWGPPVPLHEEIIEPPAPRREPSAMEALAIADQHDIQTRFK